MAAILRMTSSETTRFRRWWRSMHTSRGTSKNTPLHIVAVIFGKLDPALAVVGCEIGRVHVAHGPARDQPRFEHGTQVRKNQILKALFLGIVE